MKRSLVVEQDGGPLAVVIAGANVPDHQLLAATIEAVVVERPEPEWPQYLCLDKGNDRGSVMLRGGSTARSRACATC